MKAQIKTTSNIRPVFRSGKSNDSSAFARALSEIGCEASHKESIKSSKDEVLMESENEFFTSIDSKYNISENSMLPVNQGEYLQIEVETKRNSKPQKEIKANKVPQKTVFNASRMDNVIAKNYNLMQTEIETLRSRITNLTIKNKKLEAENSKLKSVSSIEVNSKVIGRVCTVNVADTKDDSRRTAFLKDKIMYLQNQVDILTKGITFNKQLVYNAEGLLNELIFHLNSHLNTEHESIEKKLTALR